MTIEILPARLANQIAAGEVVERPASVIKELVENSLDSGATKITIEVDKGGAKRIKITDNGAGIAQQELTLALSRHATSKIKNLDDLEAINSLGFRGEALASISSVSRLTLTSKPAAQDTAWQAIAEGRDMKVNVQPAAHPDGTTIDVKDLFFNTPARRKFLRTEKTEFTHIEEVVRRIALAQFDVTFVLIHNGNPIRHYRAAQNQAQTTKRVAQICGQKFIEHAIEVDCQHDNLHLKGWLATPSYARNQNDLCYSYVNGRMMRDKLINHAIRQAYADLLPSNTYPAFVLFLTLDFAEVDVNVHPAKHEVRFHQGRYVHDFIFSVCQNALQSQQALPESIFANEPPQQPTNGAVLQTHQPKEHALKQIQAVPEASYISPLRSASIENSSYTSAKSHQYKSHVSDSAAGAYQKLMTPADSFKEEVSASEQLLSPETHIEKTDITFAQPIEMGRHFIAPCYLVMSLRNEIQQAELRLVSLSKLDHALNLISVKKRWQQGIISQPLLLPIKLTFEKEQVSLLVSFQAELASLGIIFTGLSASQIQIRQFPALLRHRDVHTCIKQLVVELEIYNNKQSLPETADFQSMLALLMSRTSFTEIEAITMSKSSTNVDNSELAHQLLLNSVAIDLTSAIQELTSP